ncbi:MAG: uracil-DNA glycosylase family protein [Chloroflexota bacterium]|jgi:uracil-DNA glycosylase
MHHKTSVSLEKLHSEMRGCRRCLQAGYQIVPGAIFTGHEGSRVLLIGQAPGVTEVEAKRPFNAGSGRRLFQWLGEAGWDEDEFRDQHYMTAVTKCYPGRSNSGRGDRVPSKEEQRLCRPYLVQEINLIQPRLIIPVGGLAIKRFFPSKLRLDEIIGTAIYYDKILPSERDIFDLKRGTAVGDFSIELPSDSVWLVPLPHPSGASVWPNRPQNKALIDKAIHILRQIRLRYDL